MGLLIVTAAPSQVSACPSLPVAPEITCAAGTVNITGEISLSALPLILVLDGSVSMINAGTLSFDAGNVVSIVAERIDYRGDAAKFVAPNGTAFTASLTKSSYNKFVLNDTIEARKGLSIEGMDGDDIEVDIDVQSGLIDAVDVGIETNDRIKAVDVSIGAAATVKAALPLVLRARTSRLTLAGTLQGTTGSQLGGGDSVLELHPGFGLEGPVEGEGGTNRLIWGGKGRGSFDLSEIDTEYKQFQQFSKEGESVWTLAGNAPRSLGIVVDGGVLNLVGHLSPYDTTFVRPSGTLTGTGTAGDLDIEGTLDLGSSGSLFTGEVAFQAGSILRVTVDSAGGGKLIADGVRSLDRAAVIVTASGRPEGPVSIVHSSEEFDAEVNADAVTVVSTRYRATLQQTAHDLLVLVEKTGKSFSDFARTDAERAVAARLDALGEGAPFYAALDSMPDEELQLFLTQLAGEDLAIASDLLLRAAGTVNSAAQSRLQQASGALPTTEPIGFFPIMSNMLDPQPARLWGQLVGSALSGNGASSKGVALTIGLDTQLGEDALAGFMLGIGVSQGAADKVELSSLSLSAGGYGAQNIGDFGVRLAGAVSVGTVSTRRAVVGPGISDLYQAQYPSLSMSGSLEVIRTFHIGPVTAELFGDLAYSGLGTPSFMEEGGPAALSVAQAWHNSVDAALGMRLGQDFSAGTALVTATASLAALRRYSAPSAGQYSLAGSLPFEISPPSAGGWGWQATAGIAADLDEATQCELQWRAEWIEGTLSQSVSGKLARRL